MIDHKIYKGAKKLGLVSALALTVSWAAHADVKAADARTFEFDVVSMPLNEALIQFSVQSEWQFLSSQKVLKGKTAKAVSGSMSREEALHQLLGGTGLAYAVDGKGQVRIVPHNAKSNAQSNARGGKAKSGDMSKGATFQYASAEAINTIGTDATTGSGGADGAEGNGDEKDKGTYFGKLSEDDLEEIVVTGSHIRGARSASPVFLYGRQDIEQTGVSTVPQFMQTLPQNFGGGAVELPTGVTNVNRGTGINLRGLGDDSTLVLLNGRRLAPVGVGNFVDVSMIPLSAIERIEVLTDGASAIYGSDAVGGVVNFKLREDYDGAETRVRYGSATSGDLDDIQVGQTFGTTWDTGHVLVSYDYQNRDGLDTEDRSFTKDQPDPTDLLPQQKRHSFFLTGGQSLTDNIKVFGDAFYSKRNAKRRDSFGATTTEIQSKTQQYGTSIGAKVTLSEDWQAEAVGSFNQSTVSTPSPSLGLQDFTSTNWGFEAKVDGSLFALPGGDVKLAVGGHVRREAYKETRTTLSTPFIDADRTVYGLFGEMFVPLVGTENRMAGVERLELTVAGRFEDYSDFGSSTDNKLGLLWSPVKGFNLRGTYGTSFRVPLFRELFDTIVGALIPFFPDPTSPTGVSLAVFASGANSGLQPETATTWTAGFGIAPPSLPAFNMQVTYFNIDFKDRIGRTGAFFDALTDPRFALIVDRSPDPALLALIGAQTSSFDLSFGASAFTDAEVLIDDRLRNLSNVQTTGLDINLSYTLDGGDVGSFNFNLNSTYLFKQTEQILPTDSPVDLIGTVRNPPDLKLRGSVSWAYSSFSANLAANYIDGFRNIAVDPVEAISSWTTIDMNINYRTEDSTDGGWLDNTVFSLSALNLFDLDPPFAASAGLNQNFDASNANVLGRTIAFQITKQW